MDFYNIFNDLCNQNNIKPSVLADELKISRGTVTGWKSGKIPSSDILIKLSTRFNVSVDYLLFGKDNNSALTLSIEENKIIKEYRYLSDKSKTEIRSTLNHLYDMEMQMEISSELAVPTISIPHSLFKVSAGVGEWLPEESWNTILILDTPQARKADFALTIEGDSMMPDFENGDIVLVKKQDAVDIGQICIYIIEGNGYIKKFGGDRLISLNKKYDDILFSDYDIQDIHCKGLVIGKV